MLTVTTVQNTPELEQILQLQEENLIPKLSDAEMKSQGFVTLQYSPEVLLQMHQLAPSIIAKDNDTVVAYALTMLRECRSLVPSLEPMFATVDKLSLQHKALNDHNYYVMGQICIAKKYRGQGLFDQLYMKHKEVYQSRFDLIVTEISTRNHRSLRAHERIGFDILYMHRDELDEWAVVTWDWS